MRGGQNSKENWLLILNQLPFNPRKGHVGYVISSTLANPDKVMFLSSFKKMIKLILQISNSFYKNCIATE